MSCTPPPTSSHSTFTVSLDGTTVNVSPTSHGTQKLDKSFHLVITDDSAIFADDPIQFDSDPPYKKIFVVRRKSDCYVKIKDKPKPGKKIKYGFRIGVTAPGGGPVFYSPDPSIVNDPEDL